MSTTLFTWGYFGWGNATPRLIEIADAVERDRGFAPPLFVDVRIRRTVRAKGFQGADFGHLLGRGRHVWIQRLGNEASGRRQNGQPYSRRAVQINSRKRSRTLLLAADNAFRPSGVAR